MTRSRLSARFFLTGQHAARDPSGPLLLSHFRNIALPMDCIVALPPPELVELVVGRAFCFPDAGFLRRKVEQQTKCLYTQNNTIYIYGKATLGTHVALCPLGRRRPRPPPRAQRHGGEYQDVVSLPQKMKLHDGVYNDTIRCRRGVVPRRRGINGVGYYI